MRVLLDANILISYLLPTKDSEKSTTIHSIIDAGFAGNYTVVFPQELLSEMRNKIKEKPYLAKHIRQDEMEQFLTLLTSVGELLTPITEEIPVVTQDAKDDYLIAYAMVGECDYLVTGDPDVLDIEKIGHLQIVSPAAFLKILNP
jgi:putative PIN family toxin of toxin-antitoxin system